MTPAWAQIEVQQAIAARARRGGGGGGASGGAINWNAIMNGGNGAAPAAPPSTGQIVDQYYQGILQQLANDPYDWRMLQGAQ
jgi:cyanophycinase-like exopeptidase